MVRSKDVPKKPKDPLLTPPSKPRGFSFRDDGGGGFGGSLPRNRGGAAMTSPAPASVPNYMRATSSSGARAGQRQRAGVAPSSPSASASTPTRQRRPVRVVPRGKVLFPAPAASPGMVRPTCSSTLKDAKFPGALDLAPGATDAEGPVAMRVCPYTYCSLNGHAHAPAVPLRSFLAKRRRLIKTQQSMKHRGVSAFRRTATAGHQRPDAKTAGAVAKVAPPLVDEDALLGDFFVEVYTGPRVSSGTSCSDMSLDEMDATVRRMEFVVFDRCTDDDDDNNRGNDLGVHGDGDGEGTPEERPGVCSDSSSECSDADTSGDLVEELPWMRYECDSLDDDVSEEHGVIHEGTEVQQEGGKDEEGTSGRFGDEGEEESDEEPKPEGDEIFSDLPREMGIVAEEEGVGCRVDTAYQQEDSRGEDTQHPGDDEDCLSEVARKMEIAAEQACTVEVCKVLEEEVEDRSEEISESEVAERVENVLEDLCKEENSADQEAKDDETNMQSASAGQLEVAEKQEGESEMGIAETVPEVTCKEDSSEQEATCRAVSEGKISDSSAIGSPDVEISHEPRNGSFEQDVNSVEDAFEQDVNTVEDASEQFDTTAENTASGTEDARMGLEIATCKSVDASEESGISHERSQDLNSVCVDAPVQMEPEITEHKPDDSSEESSIPQESSQSSKSAHVDNGAQIEVSADAPAQKVPEITECKLEQSFEESGIAQESSQDFNSVCVDAPVQMEPEITEHKPEDSFEESSIPQESSQNSKSACVDNGAQIEVSADAPAQMVPEITECKLEEYSEESGIPQESSQSDKSALVNNGAETEPEFTIPQEESGVAQDIVHDDNSAYLGEGAQMQLGNVPSELEDTPESSTAHEIGEDEDSASGSDDAQDGSEITTCELDDASESITVQEADQDHSCADVSGGAQNESEPTTSELVNASEGSDVSQEAGRDDNTADVNDGPKEDPETMACESENAHEDLDITQIGHEDDCSAGALNETKIMTRGTKGACEEVCITEEVNLSPVVQMPQHKCELSATDGNGEPESLPADSTGEPQSLPAKENDAKEFSVDDMCSVFSGMNLKGDVYVDPTESDISPRKRLIIAGRRRTPEEEEHMRGFNPRAPNFLPLELDPDSEKVDLKHQTAEDRKNAEEWMIDYALRRAVNNLGGRKKKVELLVQAFETVLPHDEDEKKNISPTRPVQACN